MRLRISRSFLFLRMPIQLRLLCFLILLTSFGCTRQQDSSFDPWAYFGDQTTHVLAFNHTSLGLQNLKQQQNRGLGISWNELPSIVDSLSLNLNHQGSSILFLNRPTILNQSDNTKTTFTWVISETDTTANTASKEFIHKKDTVFVFSKNQYRIVTNTKANLPEHQNPHYKTINGLVKMIQLKKDKPLVIGQKLERSLGHIRLNQGSWAVYDVQSNSGAQSAHGILLINDKDSLMAQNQKPLALDLGQNPSVLKTPEVIPIGAQSSLSLALNSPESLTAKIRAVDSLFTPHPFIETLEEASLIELNNSKALVIKSLDLNLSLGALTKNWNSEETYRGVVLRSFDPEQSAVHSLSQIFSELPIMTQLFTWEDFLILTPTKELAQQYISALYNKNTLKRSSIWLSAEEDLSRESTLLSWINDKETTQFRILQLTTDQGFSHLNYSVQYGDQKVNNKPSGPLLQSIRLNAPALGVPKFFSNHKTGGKDIVVQDLNHRLYFIKSNGKISWYRDLNEPILGSIQEVDLLRNGKKQLAFVTASKWYVIDRNGRDVRSFPKRFQDPRTQPLAIFDYDNNRKYRFVIVQDRFVLMYDAKGKRVKGFTYNKAPTTVSHPPKHLRIRGKDYLLFLLKNGQLKILSRTGKVRVPVQEQFDFGTNVPIKRDGKFVFWTKEGSQIQISPNGTVDKLTAKSPVQYRAVYQGLHTIEFDDPILRIDQHLIELPLGDYLGPQVFKFGNKLRTVMIDKERQNIYVYNSEGRLSNDYPLFGTSTIDMADINKNGHLEIVVLGQDNEVLIYRID